MVNFMLLGKQITESMGEMHCIHLRSVASLCLSCVLSCYEQWWWRFDVLGMQLQTSLDKRQIFVMRIKELDVEA